MSNEKFRRLSIGDEIYVYDHSSRKHYPAQVMSIKGEGLVSEFGTKFITFNGCSVEFCADPKRYHQKGERPETGTFYINFSEESSRRGSAYTGFLTEEDAEEFRLFILNQKIEELEKEISKLEQNKTKKLDN
jgi:hypothetical protein